MIDTGRYENIISNIYKKKILIKNVLLKQTGLHIEEGDIEIVGETVTFNVSSPIRFEISHYLPKINKDLEQTGLHIRNW
jgi:hypothetical protein